jgi:hypothetical protein
MPVPALPIPPAPRPQDLVNLYRGYYDLLQRPMRGSVMITGTNSGDSVKVDLVEGVLDLNLPADEYLLEAALWNVDGATSSRVESVTLSRPE